MAILSLQEQESLKTLTDAVNDTGYWCYWLTDAPFTFQAELNWVQLWNTSLQEPITKPNSLIALRFDGIRSLEFLSFTYPTPNIPENWPELMSQDNLPLANNVLCTFNSQTVIERELLNCKRRTSPFGSGYKKGEDFYQTKFQCLVIGGDVGFLVSANHLHLINGHGEERTLNDVPELSAKWWEYWRAYWNYREKDQAFPYDPACEVTIPIK